MRVGASVQGGFLECRIQGKRNADFLGEKLILGRFWVIRGYFRGQKCQFRSFWVVFGKFLPF